MKKAAGVLTAMIVIALAIILFDNSSGRDEATAMPVSSIADASPPPPETEDTESTTDEASEVTRDEFNQLPRQEQDEMLDEYILDLWAKELGLTESDAEEKGLSLEIFDRPYMLTLTEREFALLSPEDQKKAVDEIFAALREVHSYTRDVIAEANSSLKNKEYANAEAYFVHCLEIGRELSINKEGMVATRWGGLKYQRDGLSGLEKLYTELGEHSKVQMARDQLAQVEREREEMRRFAEQSKANS